MNNIIYKYKNVILYAIFFLIFIFFSLDAAVYKFDFDVKFIVIAALYIITWIVSKENYMQILGMNSIKKVSFLLIVIIGIMFFINAIIFNVKGYLAYGFLFTFIFSFFLICNIDVKSIIDQFVNVSIVFNIISIIVSVALEPLNPKEQYASVYHNPNSFGMFLTIFTVSVLMRVIKYKKIQYVFLLSIDIVLVLLSESRITVLNIIVLLTIVSVYNFKIKKRIDRNTLFKIMSFIILILITWNASIFILKNITPSIKATLQPNNEYHKYHNSDRSKHFMMRIEKGIFNDERFTSGRKEIWKEFIVNLKILGHENETIVFRTKMDGVLERDAHNSVLQLAYTSGVISGLCLLSILIIGSIQVIRFLLAIGKNKYEQNDAYIIFVTMVFCTYAVNSMSTAMYNFQHSIMSFAFWMIGFKVINFNYEKHILI